MDSTRQQRIGYLIREELAQLLLADSMSLYHCMITVTRTTVTKDLSIARSYLSIYDCPDRNAVLAEIRQNTKSIRFRLGQKLKNHLRIIPRCEFFIDDTLDYIENIEKLLKQ
ncbi:MAG: ribosome-binding factor A [Bacteroidales bacterium]|jgi:ribosome-binding factor A|nr:ribosome-binding factor A [Bacteroidales bacterium]